MASQNLVNESAEKKEGNGICGDVVKSHPEPRFECPICLAWLRDPVLTSCGHKFCSECIYTWLQKKATCCPVDSMPLNSETDLFRDLYTSREISQQRTKCMYQEFGCNIELSPVEMEVHITECSYKGTSQHSQEICCRFKDVGCTEVFASEEASRAHLEKDYNEHLTMLMNAFSKISMTSQGVNSLAVESQLWDPPPKNQAQLEKQDAPPEWQQLLKNLYERIVVLEQQNRELTIAITNQKVENNRVLQTLVRFNQEEMFLRNCNGVYIWRLNSFNEKLTVMVNDPLKMFYSPGFYTSPNGYKICARINISSKDPDFLSILLHIMKSENDDALDWPFNGMMYFVLIHPHNTQKDIREMTFSRAGLEAFRKPACELNKRSFGYTEFVRVSDIRDFLRDECLLFRIEVKVCNTFEDSSL